MNKRILLAVVIVLIASVGIGGFFIFSQNKQPVSTNNPASSQNQQTQSTGGNIQQKSIKDLFSLGVAQECTFSDASGNGGTVYVGNNKMRGDFTSAATAGGQSVATHIISDGKTAYMWLNDDKSGYKMSFDLSTQTGAVDNKTQGNNVDVNKSIDFRCKPWVVNTAMFSTPTDVKFTDFGTVSVPTGVANTQDTKALQCSACDSAPDEAKAQCKATLGCN